MARHVGEAAGPQRILEAGPGTGAVTSCIVERMPMTIQLWMVELNPTFAAHLRTAFKQKPELRAVADRCHIVEGSVQALGREGEFDLVVSGLPLNNFSSDDVRMILDAYAKLLKPSGILSFFQYIFIRPAKMIVSRGPERVRLKNVGCDREHLGERDFARELSCQRAAAGYTTFGSTLIGQGSGVRVNGQKLMIEAASIDAR